MDVIIIAGSMVKWITKISVASNGDLSVIRTIRHFLHAGHSRFLPAQAFEVWRDAPAHKRVNVQALRMPKVPVLSCYVDKTFITYMGCGILREFFLYQLGMGREPGSQNGKGIKFKDDLFLNDYQKPKTGKPGTMEGAGDSQGKNNHHKSYGYLRTPELSELVKEFIEAQ